MKKYFLLLASIIFIVTTAYLLSQTAKKGENRNDSVIKKPATKVVPKTVLPQPKKKDKAAIKGSGKDHSKLGLNCKTCHACEYPTNQDPCLLKCPRTQISVYHSPQEGPEVLVLDDLSKKFGGVVFSHKIHAQMSEMSHGCTGCHHYNSTGPVLNCKKCHEHERQRNDISKPTLEAAYHRQCMQCHRQWDQLTGCNSCHLPIGKEGIAKKDEALKKMVGKNHPEMEKPNRIVYETSSDKGKYVTFYHNDHVSMFKQTCINCHKDENCVKCHDQKKVVANLNHPDREKKVHKDFDQHHKPCSSCHDNKKCSKCHQDKPMEPFNHAITAKWPLKSYHSRLSCQNCHQGSQYKKIGAECQNCHKNFAEGKFDHKSTGLALSENHKDAACQSCHSDNSYSKSPVCKECHDDKSFPKQLPGKKMKLKR